MPPNPSLPRPAKSADLPAVLALLHDAFAYMDGVIDPPSSLARMTLAALEKDAAQNEVWVIAAPPVACVILTPKPPMLYLGKLAVAQGWRGRGLSRRLVDLAMERARALGLAGVQLQTRVELSANHAAFQAMGFSETARTAHPGYAHPTSITFERHL